MTETPRADGKHAIVLGGSMAGLLATRVLSDHFGRVSLIERDALPAQAEQRRGVPQGRHTHGLLASGRNVLEKLFPGICEALLKEGAVSHDIVRDSRWFFEGACLSRPPSGLDGLLMTRPLLEAAVRERVLANPKVVRRDGLVVEELLADRKSVRVTGVRASGQALLGDLVVDATGRGSRSPQWLEQLGYEKPAEDVVQIGLGYTTRFFRRKPTDFNGDTAVVIPPTPKGKRGGVMLAQEGDRWTVTLIGHFGNYAPEDLDGFIAFARTLPAPTSMRSCHVTNHSAKPHQPDFRPAFGDATSCYNAFPRAIWSSVTRFAASTQFMGKACLWLRSKPCSSKTRWFQVPAAWPRPFFVGRPRSLRFPGVLLSAPTCAFPRRWADVRRALSSLTGTSPSCTKRRMQIQWRRWLSTGSATCLLLRRASCTRALRPGCCGKTCGCRGMAKLN